MAHIGLKPSLEVKLDFDINKSLRNISDSENKKRILQSYIDSNNFAEHYDYDLLLQTNNSLIAGFEYLFEGKKVMMQEINPVTIYYSNAVMSNYLIESYKNILLEKNMKGIISSHAFGNFFQLAFNCIINLQTCLETFLNNILNENEYKFYNKNNKKIRGSILEKIETALPEILNKTFKNDYEPQFIFIKNLISIRNEMIHLKPDKQETNSKYKVPYRKILDFQFDKTVEAVKTFINYHQKDLIEECNCGRDFHFDITGKE